MWVPSPGQEDPLEKEMAAHSCILAWTEELLQATVIGVGVCPRVGHDS